MKEKQWDIQDHLQDTKQIAQYLETVIKEDDNDMLLVAIVDAVKALKRIRETPPKDLKEARKWIGKLCCFWNDEDQTEIYYEVLTCITRKGLYYAEGLGEAFDNCEPITADDELIYKGE